MSSDHEHETREDVPNMSVNRRHVPADRMRQFEDYVAEILSAFGMDPDTPATRDTPRRFLQAMFDSTDTSRSSGSPSSRGWSACSRNGSPCRSGSASRSPTPWTPCFIRTALRCTWTRTTSAPRCAGFGKPRRSRARRSGAGITKTARRCGPNFSSRAACIDSSPAPGSGRGVR
jgi:hypothetical protein